MRLVAATATAFALAFMSGAGHVWAQEAATPAAGVDAAGVDAAGVDAAGARGAADAAAPLPDTAAPDAGAPDASAPDAGAPEDTPPEAVAPGTATPAALTAESVAESLSGNWAETVATAAESVVSLKLSQLRTFDDSPQGASSATGFVVDAERGIILTNRHVLGSGPMRISATFQNQERVDVLPLYRDPVHDFAFLRYNPADLEYAQPAALELRPDKVRTGVDIRVIGSDGGEQLSILPGTIARLDREVPGYGRYGYNDFNTFYLQAASGTSGGSSGSPVIDIDGDVLALNAAANKRTASSFFLPLPRIQHALALLQQDEAVNRGSFETLFRHQPFRELRRLGFDTAREAALRPEHPAANGLLVVEQVIPGGVADGKLQAGDILLSIKGEAVTDFVTLEGLLDDAIGQTLPVEVLRLGQEQTLDLNVADLHAISPARFLELGDSILQDMSIQHARAMNRPREGVVLAAPGYVFSREAVPEGAVIVQVNGLDVKHLDDFIAAVKVADPNRPLSIRYIVPGQEFSSKVAQIDLDDRWFRNRLCERVDDARFWSCEAEEIPARLAATAEATSVPDFGNALLNRVAPAMVRVGFDIPHSLDNVYARHFVGVGVIVDAEQGLVAVDRNTVPVGLGDAEITLFGSLIIPADVVFLHPQHNIALLKYAPDTLDGLRIKPLKLAADDELPESLTMIGYRQDGTLRASRVDAINRLTIGFPSPGLARFQQSVIDVYGVPNLPPTIGGPIVDNKGTVHALYMSFSFEDNREIHQEEYAMPAAVLAEALRLYQAGEPYRSIDARFGYQPLSLAVQLGLPESWLERYNTLPPERRRALVITQVLPGTEAADRLRPGDFLVAIDGELVSDIFDAEKHLQKEHVALTVLRAGAIVDIDLPTTAVDTLGTDRIVSWGGAVFQENFHDIGFQKGVNFPGVYIADTLDGSPAIWDGLYRNRFVTAVEGQPVSNLDELLDALAARDQDEITRLTVTSMSGRPSIVAVQPEYNFWPTFELRREADGWTRIDHGS